MTVRSKFQRPRCSPPECRPVRAAASPSLRIGARGTSGPTDAVTGAVPLTSGPWPSPKGSRAAHQRGEKPPAKRERERARGAEERETPSLQPPRLPPSPPQPPPRRGARRRREEALEGSRRGRRRLRLRQATRSRGSAAGWCIGVQRLAGAGRCWFSVSPLDPLAAGAFARASPPPRIEGSG